MRDDIETRARAGREAPPREDRHGGPGADPYQGPPEGRRDGPGPDAGAGAEPPGAPTELPPPSWRDAVKRTVGEFKKDNLTDWAAALTYYAVLSIFPGLLVVVSLVGLGGAALSQSLITSVGELVPGQVREVLVAALTELQKARFGAGIAALIGLVAAVWSASRYVAAFMRASNAIWDIPEGRPIWKTMPIRVGVTLLTLVLLAAMAIVVVISGPLARRAGDLLGLGQAAVTAWDIVKWPIILLVVSFLFALLYWAAPNARRGFRWVNPGGLLALVLWLAASAVFALYVANFGSYNKIYGSLAAVIIFLVWLWISNIAILLGAEFNAELERGRAIAGGHPAAAEPYVEPRDTRKFPKNQQSGSGLA
ncbi:YihY/virulence factor BrkB family protein [Thermopolyspora sp. NPDC052614]|uniref:YihY/virulence factor BrkB family protein n=1 Tax=Thermopolyspora sp. NPDC052614 TaxID=3155682 RepID=UPI0034296B2E